MMNKRKCLSVLLIFNFLIAAANDFRGDTVDIKKISLYLDFTDFSTKVMRAKASINIEAKQSGVEFIHLDLLKLTVDSVKVNGIETVFSYNDTLLNIYLSTTLQQGEASEVSVFYHGNPYRMNGDFGGFYWNSTYAFNIGVSFLSDPHTYGRVWFPCFDNFEERSLYEFFITTKNIHKAFCNGILADVTNVGNNKIWHWEFGQQIQSYLASVTIAPYSTLSDTVLGMDGIKPIELAALPSDTAQLSYLFTHLKDAFHIFEDMFGPYRWDRVGYCIVPFSAGAMEHATNISFMQYYLSLIPEEAESTMAHELSHHWFGDLVTCTTASDMWLNEGWASYCEHLFHERLYGHNAYQQDIKNNHEYVLHLAHIKDGAYLPVSGVPSSQTYGRTVYDKGADVSRTLRSYMGDADFFRCLKNYMNDFAWKNASSIQFRDYLSQCSGKNLDHFFSDWVFQAGFPHFEIDSFSVSPSPTLQGNDVTVFIRQRLNNANHYYNNVPLVVSYFGEGGFRVNDTVLVNGNCAEVSRYFPNVTPNYIALDFDENLADAITDEWLNIDTVGTYDFGTAKMKVQLLQPISNSILRVEHHWVAPLQSQNTLPDLKLHDYRYWTVDGTVDANMFSANADIVYNGQTNDAGQLDNTFLSSIPEDSIVLLYRTHPWMDWSIADSFLVNIQGSSTDRIGSVRISGLKKGQYTLAIKDAAHATPPDVLAPCMVSGIASPATAGNVAMFPNPTSGDLFFEIKEGTYRHVDIQSIIGETMISKNINDNERTFKINFQQFQKGAYVVSLTDTHGNRISKLIFKL